MKAQELQSPLQTKGIVLHKALGYDLLLSILWFGRERRFREKLLRLAGVKPGETLLDVGCGTGTLAIAAKRQVGPAGSVHGVDASPEMLARAKQKAKRSGLDVEFRQGLAEALPFPASHFDVVTATVMLHHLPKPTRQQCACEIRRVLKTGGRLLLVDFDNTGNRHSIIGRFHRHSYVSLSELQTLASEAGLEPVESGPVGLNNLQFVLATKLADGTQR